MDYKTEIEKVKASYFMGCISYEEAKIQCEPLLEEMNKKIVEISKKHGKKPYKMTFTGLFR